MHFLNSKTPLCIVHGGGYYLAGKQLFFYIELGIWLHKYNVCFDGNANSLSKLVRSGSNELTNSQISIHKVFLLSDDGDCLYISSRIVSAR